MKNKTKRFFIVLMTIICLFISIGCGDSLTNKIASVSYKNLNGNIVTVSSYYVYGIKKIEMRSTKGEFLEDVTKLTTENQCVSTSKSMTYTTTKEIPSGLFENHSFIKDPNLTGIQYSPYSGKYNCYVEFKIYFSDIEENYDITIKRKNGMMTITYPYITGDIFPYCNYSTIDENTITISQENVTINYS